MYVNKFGKVDLKIDQFESKKKSTDSIFSPYFYSHLNGYKLKLQVFPGGHSDAEGTHLSASFHISKGEYDDDLEWPCKYIFEIGIVNQWTGLTHNNWIFSYDRLPTEFRHVFDKPTMSKDSGWGETEFISHINLHATEGLIVDDTVVVRCTVHGPM